MAGSIEQVMRDKLEARYAVTANERDIGYLLDRWRRSLTQAQRSVSAKLLGNRKYWTNLVP